MLTLVRYRCIASHKERTYFLLCEIVGIVVLCSKLYLCGRYHLPKAGLRCTLLLPRGVCLGLLNGSNRLRQHELICLSCHRILTVDQTRVRFKEAHHI